MTTALSNALVTLRNHEAEVRSLGVEHAAVFGSVARSESRPHSDVDTLIDLDQSHPNGVFEYSRLKLHIASLFDYSADIVNLRDCRRI